MPVIIKRTSVMGFDDPKIKTIIQKHGATVRRSGKTAKAFGAYIATQGGNAAEKLAADLKAAGFDAEVVPYE